MSSENYAIIGPGGATNNSVKKNAKRLVKETVLTSYFRNTWNARNQSQNYAIWNTSGKMVGFALIKKKGTELEISLIGAKQGRGIGSRLMDQIISDAKNRGITRITLDSVPSALKFYMKYGFILTAFDDEHIHMKLDLVDPFKLLLEQFEAKQKAKAAAAAKPRRRTTVSNKLTSARNTRRAATASRRTASRTSALAASRK